MKRLLLSSLVASLLVCLASFASAADSSSDRATEKSPSTEAHAIAQEFSLPASVTTTCGITCAQADLDGSGTVGANDLSKWLAKFFSGTYDPAYDYDHNGSLTANDLSFWVCAFWQCTP